MVEDCQYQEITHHWDGDNGDDGPTFYSTEVFFQKGPGFGANPQPLKEQRKAHLHAVPIANGDVLGELLDAQIDRQAEYMEQWIYTGADPKEVTRQFYSLAFRLVLYYLFPQETKHEPQRALPAVRR